MDIRSKPNDRIIRDILWIVAAILGTAVMFWLAGAAEAARPQRPRPAVSGVGGRAAANENEAPRALESPHHKELDKLAQQHAEYMARVQVQGHQGFDQRYRRAIEATGCRSGSEICAETWTWQKDATAAAQWAEYVKCWRQSPGHWRTASVRHKWIGIGSARGANGVWYGCLIAAD